VAKKHSAAIALGLIDGKSPVEACVDAGIKESTAKAHAWEIIKSPEVRRFLVEYGATITRSELSNLARARLAEALQDPNISGPELVPAIRTALEHGGEIGANREIMHKHQIELSPAIQALLSKRIYEIAQAEGKIIDMPVEPVSLPALPPVSSTGLHSNDNS